MTRFEIWIRSSGSFWYRIELRSLGFYYSGMDWYYDRGHVNFARGGSKKMNYKGEVVDELRPQPADRATAFKAFNKRQVKELIIPFNPDI